MTCRMCDKLEPRGCGYTSCKITGKVIKDFDKECTCKNTEFNDSTSTDTQATVKMVTGGNQNTITVSLRNEQGELVNKRLK